MGTFHETVKQCIYQIQTSFHELYQFSWKNYFLYMVCTSFNEDYLVLENINLIKQSKNKNKIPRNHINLWLISCFFEWRKKNQLKLCSQVATWRSENISWVKTIKRLWKTAFTCCQLIIIIFSKENDRCIYFSFLVKLNHSETAINGVLNQKKKKSICNLCYTFL